MKAKPIVYDAGSSLNLEVLRQGQLEMFKRTYTTKPIETANSEQELRQITLIDKTVIFDIEISREDFPAISAIVT